MRILWLRPDKPDNISVGRHRIAKELEERGHEVDVRGANLGSFRTVLSENPDVVVGTTRLGAFVGVWTKLMKRVPLVVDHIDPIQQLRRNKGAVLTWLVSQSEKLSFRYADHVMVVYEEEIPRVERHTDSVTKTRLGVDYGMFAEPSEDVVEEARETLSYHTDSDDKILVYIGGLEPPYRLRTIIEAMDHLEGWQFVVLGDGSDRSFVEAVSERRDDVVYLGTVPHEAVPGFLHESDIGISLLDDRNTLKILEYGACGLPVVHAEGDAEQVFDGMVEFCSPEPHDVARAVLDSHDRGFSDGLRGLAKQHSWQEIASEYEGVLEAVRN